MPTYSFIGSIFRQFTLLNWQNGISIYRSGGVINFQTYVELVSARIKTGIGEAYDVRIKLHTSGRFVQWMECTCQGNRRRGEKCAHIAAFCIFLSADKQSYLRKLNIEPGEIDEYLTLSMNKSSSKEENSEPVPFDFKEKMNLIKESKSILNDNSLENIFSQKSTDIISIDLDKEEPWINVTAKIDNNKKLNYRFGIDDTCKLFYNTNYAKKVSKNLQKLINENIKAKRLFVVTKNGKFGLNISRVVSLDLGKQSRKQIQVSEIPGSYLGRYGLFDKKYGYIKFHDNMSPVQISRWNDYPKSVALEGDQAALLIEDEFSRLKESADVILEDEVKNIKVYEKLYLPEFSLRKSIEGQIFIDAKLGTKESSRSQSDSKNTILEILKARAEGRKYIQTDKGFIKVTKEFDWLKNNVQEDGEIKLSMIEFIRFHEQYGKESKIKGKVEIIDKIRSGLVERDKLDMPILQNTNIRLRPYQEDGLKWLWWLYSNSLGGLLADEMGLGKTHQAMALIAAAAHQEESSLFLVVCPTTVIDHWLDKMNKFVPGIQCICYHGVHRKSHLRQLIRNKNPIVFITSYGILLRDVELLMQVRWNVNILDEAHLVKNHSSRTYRAACRLRSNMRLCLTGTPLENDLFELKNLFDYIAPNYLGSDLEFKKKYISIQEADHDPVADMELYRLIHPLKMRRNKQDVLTDLPEKVEDVRHCHLNMAQKKLYQETLSLKGTKLIMDLKNEKSPVQFIHIFSLISLLKQICNDPALIDPQYESIGSGKLDLFDELLAEALESDQKVVVFTQYAKMVDRLSKRLTLKGIKHVSLTGQSSHRGKIVKQFQEDSNIKVFLGSLLAGGTGIDLTAANIVIHFDRWWNAAKEDQATDRIHRIGQIKNVQVYKLVTKGTLEERIDGIISRKKLIFERYVQQGEDIFKHFTREDLLLLLKAPMDDREFELSPEEDKYDREI